MNNRLVSASEPGYRVGREGQALLRLLRDALELFHFLSQPWAHPAIGPVGGRYRRPTPVAATVRHAVSESPNARNLPSSDLRWRKTAGDRYHAMWIVKL